MQDIGVLPGWESSDAAGVSRNGMAVGDDANSLGQETAFRWTHNAGLLRFRDLGKANSVAYGANTMGQVVGGYEAADSTMHAFFWSSSTGLLDLGNLGGNAGATALAINNSG